MDTEHLTILRKSLHEAPELSEHEAGTAQKLADFLEPLKPDRLVRGLGGHGLAALFRGRKPGRTVLFRADLDALPIQEAPGALHASRTPGVSHACGHDGHMAALAGLAARFASSRPERGDAVLLFQPAEETGQGARAVLDDPAFAPLAPDFAVAWHNVPGFDLGSVVLRHGPFAAASTGMAVELSGRTSHAAEPEKGLNPGPALARILAALPGLPGRPGLLRGPGMATLIYAHLGEKALGTSAGQAELMATLRAYTPEDMDALTRAAEELARGEAAQDGLECAVSWLEEFPATVNNPACVETVRLAALGLGMQVAMPDAPFRWSEDFGHFTARFPAVLFGLGAGTDHPALHNPDYDFPDQLIPLAVELLAAVHHGLQDADKQEA